MTQESTSLWLQPSRNFKWSWSESMKVLLDIIWVWNNKWMCKETLRWGQQNWDVRWRWKRKLLQCSPKILNFINSHLLFYIEQGYIFRHFFLFNFLWWLWFQTMAPLQMSSTIPEDLKEKLKSRGVRWEKYVLHQNYNICVLHILYLRLEYGTINDLQRVWQVMLDAFFPDEPVFRSCGIFKEENLGSTGGKLFSWLFKMLVEECLKHNTSVLALNDKDEIVGMDCCILIDCSLKNNPSFIRFQAR